MRLIDADKLLEETRKDRDYAEKNGFLDMYYERQVLIDRIKAQPTAYSVDKVVKELEKRKQEYLDGFGVHQDNELYGVACGLGDAIEIVKAGEKNE